MSRGLLVHIHGGGFVAHTSKSHEVRETPSVILMCVLQIHHHVCEPKVPLTWGWMVSLGVSLTSCDFDVCATNPPPCMWTRSPLDMGLDGFSGGFTYLMWFWCVCYKSTTMYVNQKSLDMGLGGFSGGLSYLMWFWCVCNKSTTMYVNQKSPWHGAGWFLWRFLSCIIGARCSWIIQPCLNGKTKQNKTKY